MKIIKGYRVMLGLTQQNIAELLNVSRQTVSNKESGKVKFTDKEKTILLNEFKKVNPELTYDIFFNEKVSKSKELNLQQD